MRLDAITLEHFRNYAHQSVTFDPSVNVIVGENAQGKTNLLEAAVYLSCAKSPRARTEKEMISFDADTARLTGSVFSRGRDFTVEIELFRGKRRKMSVNQVPCKRAGDLSGVLNTVYFCPDDLLLIRDGAAARRRFMDLSLSQLRPRYDAALSEYNRLYDHKTRILRDAEEHPSLLDALPDFNLRMAQCGAVLIYYRARFCKLLADYAASAHRECSGGREELTLAYRTVGTVADPMAPQETVFEQLMAHQRDHYHAELASRLCLSGPHKDDIEVSIGGAAARAFFLAGPDPHRGALPQTRRARYFPRADGLFARPPARRCALRAGPPPAGICPQPHLRRPGLHHLLRGGPAGNASRRQGPPR